MYYPPLATVAPWPWDSKVENWYTKSICNSLYDRFIGIRNTSAVISVSYTSSLMNHTLMGTTHIKSINKIWWPTPERRKLGSQLRQLSPGQSGPTEMNVIIFELVPGKLVQDHTISFSLFFYFTPPHQNSLRGRFTNDDHTTIGVLVLLLY
jgi:hypothetical protein